MVKLKSENRNPKGSGNPKSENRDPKEIRGSKSEFGLGGHAVLSMSVWCLAQAADRGGRTEYRNMQPEFATFGFRFSFGFRISDFGFRISSFIPSAFAAQD